MSFSNPQIQSAVGTDVVPLPAPVPGLVPPTFSVLNEAPVNAVRDGGADGRGIGVDDTLALNRAIQLAIQGTRNGQIGSLYIPGGLYQISSRLALGNCTGLHVYGDGEGTIIQQQTNNEPLIEASATTFIENCRLESMFLRYVNQQNQASHPNSATIRFRNTNVNGFAVCLFRNLRIDKPTYFLQWGDTATHGFWNNNLDLIRCTNVAASLIKNSSPGAIGSPVNRCNLLTHVGGNVTTTDIALDLEVSDWDFTGLDIEDWTDRIVFADGNSNIAIRGCHLERIHLVTTNTRIFNLSQCMTHLERVDGTYYRDGAGPYFVFQGGHNTATYGGGYLGQIVTNTYAAGNLGTGQIALCNIGNDGQYSLGNYATNDIVNVVLPFFTFDGATPFGIISDQGLPPTVLSSVALPAPSATYRGRQYRIQGANATTADTLVECMQSATGTYSWKVIATG